MYLRIETNDVVTQIQAKLSSLGIQSIATSVKGQRRKSTRHMVQISLTSLEVNERMPVMYVINSYQGESPLILRVGIYEFVCSNGLMLGTDFYRGEIRHVAGPKATNWLDALPQTIAAALDAARAAMAEAERLSRIPISEFQMRVALAALSANGFGKRATELAKRWVPVESRRWPKDQQPTVLAAYSVLNEAKRLTCRSGEAALLKDADILDTLLAAVA